MANVNIGDNEYKKQELLKIWNDIAKDAFKTAAKNIKNRNKKTAKNKQTSQKQNTKTQKTPKKNQQNNEPIVPTKPTTEQNTTTNQQ